MTDIDASWKLQNPAGYDKYFSIYKIRVVHLMLYFIKHLRRHKQIEYAFFDKTGTEVDSYIFVLAKDGSISTNHHQTFSTYMDAWRWYESKLYQEFIASNDS